MSWKDKFFLLFLAIAGVIVLLVFQHDCRSRPGRDSALCWQRRIGGIGMGSVLTPAWNFRDYDPRLQPVAKDTLYPVPGGYGYSPDRLGMVTWFIDH